MKASAALCSAGVPTRAQTRSLPNRIEEAGQLRRGCGHPRYNAYHFLRHVRALAASSLCKVKPIQLTGSAKLVLELRSIAESAQLCSYIDCDNSQKGDS